KEDYALFAQWRNRSGGGAYKPPVLQTGGHYWGRFIKNHQKEFDADPSLYALVRQPDGTLKRKGPQIEAADPRIAEMMANDIKSTFAKNNWPHDKIVGFPIG